MADKNEIIELDGSVQNYYNTIDIQNLIYVIRGQQVMLDSDLAMLYEVTTGALNQAAKRNIARFPEDFRFQLAEKEYENLKSQIVISNENAGRGGRRKNPFVYTEQGISMLASVLHSEVAITTSIKIMRAFVQMKKFMINNALMFERIKAVEMKQLMYQEKSDEKFDEIFRYISEHEAVTQKIFFDGQIFDAFSLLADIIGHASKEIILIDGYVDLITLNILAKKNDGVDVMIYTLPSARLTNQDINNFNAQYPQLTVKETTVFHDRFLIIDGAEGYHIGASIKDAGKRCFGINKIEGQDYIADIIVKAQNSST
jgi:uncharacterized protein YcbK (DUF882 family)